MLSGNGRHRRPRQAPALLVAAGVTGSAIAIPLLGATGASAADGTTWDKVADCETGGAWSADTGNGFYGGLHLNQERWEKYGGLEYASSADKASRSQQIAVAEKVLADIGPGAWPTCGLLSGLGSDSGSSGVDTGAADEVPSRGLDNSSGSPGSSNSSGSSESSSESSSGSSGASDRPSDPASAQDDSATGSTEKPSPSSSSPSSSAESDKSAKSDSSADSGGEASQSPESSPAEDRTVGKADESDKAQQSAGSWSLVDTGSIGGGTGRHRGGSADEGAGESVDAGAKAASTGRHAYTVRPGDTLASIADSLGLDGGWSELYAENRQAIGADPNNISAGQTLRVGA
ncbi:transglycosylase family protein [Streptomyces griseus]|uniref:LysM peptidoglycan-binding domain-containing protein n=1 Tax=Streptomyces griseus TaxID=1911 RepID=UPI000568E1E6|nr:transglycosylase family protein [Streptomyces griseus]